MQTALALANGLNGEEKAFWAVHKLHGRLDRVGNRARIHVATIAEFATGQV
jgi:hypothetical protein